MYILFAFGCFYVATYVLLFRNSGSNRHYSASPPNAPPNSATVLTLLAFECAPFVPLCGIGGAHPFAITIPITMRSYIGYGYILRIYYTNLVNLTAVKYNGGRNYKTPNTINDQRYSHTLAYYPAYTSRRAYA